MTPLKSHMKIMWFQIFPCRAAVLWNALAAMSWLKHLKKKNHLWNHCFCGPQYISRLLYWNGQSRSMNTSKQIDCVSATVVVLSPKHTAWLLAVPDERLASWNNRGESEIAAIASRCQSFVWDSRKSCSVFRALGLGDISHAMIMRISSVKPVLWLALNLHHLFSNWAAVNTQSRSSLTS